jgi:hypothetical protein
MRCEYVLAVVAVWAGLGYFAGLFIYPQFFAPILLAALFVGSFYLAIFVWPRESSDEVERKEQP